MNFSKWSSSVVALVFLVQGATVAAAQMADAVPGLPGADVAPAPNPALALRRVAKACAGEVPRFCPSAQDSRSARDMLICLRPYRMDLPPACRGAINAVRH